MDTKQERQDASKALYALIGTHVADLGACLEIHNAIQRYTTALIDCCEEVAKGAVLDGLRAVERGRNAVEVVLARAVEERRDGPFTTADDKALGVAFRPEEDR